METALTAPIPALANVVAANSRSERLENCFIPGSKLRQTSRGPARHQTKIRRRSGQRRAAYLSKARIGAPHPEAKTAQAGISTQRLLKEAAGIGHFRI